MPPRATEDGFWSRIVKQPNGCWEWTGFRLKFGHGYLTYKRKQVLAHRLAYTLTFGGIPDGLHVCHKCDNPPCCNPSHLFIGTQLDNIADRDAKGRCAHQKGEKNGRSKLTDALVIDIRKKLSDGTETKAAIGREYGVSEVLIGLIARRKVWLHV